MPESADRTPKTQPAHQNLPDLSEAVRLAEKMGTRLEQRRLLFRALPAPAQPLTGHAVQPSAVTQPRKRAATCIKPGDRTFRRPEYPPGRYGDGRQAERQGVFVSCRPDRGRPTCDCFTRQRVRQIPSRIAHERRRVTRYRDRQTPHFVAVRRYHGRVRARSKSNSVHRHGG